MFDLDSANAWIAFGIGVGTLVGIVAGWMRWVRPRIKALRAEVRGALDALVGRDAIIDPASGRVLAEPLPGMGRRMDDVERAIAHVATLIEGQHAQDRQIAELKRELAIERQRIDTLEAGTIERVAAKAESVAAWRAIEKIADQSDPAIDGDTSDDQPPEITG